MNNSSVDYRRWKRRTVHITMALFALCIGRLPPWAICALALTALVFNVLLLPRLTARQLERPEDRARGFSLGILMYPAVLLLISLLFYEHQVFMAVAWGAMAFGDGFAGVIGEAVRGRTWPWNDGKSLVGSAAFLVLGTLLTWALVMALPEGILLGHPPERWLWIVAIGVGVAGLVETVPGTIDDNLAVPLTAACVAYAVSGVDALGALPPHWMWGAGLTALLAVLSFGAKKMDLPGAIVGALIAWSIFLGAGFAGFSALFAFFVFGSLASHWRMRDKEKAGLAQENRGRRSIRHAVSNGGVAACAGLLAWLFPELAMVFQVALAASLASATADTLSSELGNVAGRRFVNVLTWQPDERGLDGVVSLEGTLLGAAGALSMGLLFAAFGASLQAVILVVVAGVLGNYLDSVLGASLQRWGYMTNDSVNFANTAAAASFAGTLWWAFF